MTRRDQIRRDIPLNELAPHDPPAPTPAAADISWIRRDAAERAADLLANAAPPLASLVDAIRLLADRNDPELAQAVIEYTGLRSAELARLRTAFTYGGPTGVEVMLQLAGQEPEITADGDTMNSAATTIDEIRSRASAPVRTNHNGIIDDAEKLQICLGPDGRWYPFTGTADGGWAAVRRPTANPAAAYEAAKNAKRQRHG
ncbi:hypothetical protein E1264_33105 [Actinomadura sp. KC216]|uniref:hypothetical protein n=1 Tax=Actinomadura sp. KC216 TaxID=2530370 RepID=UPI00104EABF5|nr:hypothetical protein [Actinomadura sp. KC216]TDB81149.1 hypothetical protein E1264_33105 [Actinomadura sp. KC216]